MASESKSKSSMLATSIRQHPQFGELGCVSSMFREAKDIGWRNTGLLLVVGSQAFFSMMTTTVKVLHGVDPPINTFQLIWVRSISGKDPKPAPRSKGCSFAAFMSWNGRVGSRRLFKILYILSPLFRFRFVAFFGSCSALRYLSLSDATVLTFLAPMTTAVAGSVFLGERFAVGEALAGLVSLGGVVLIARPAVIFGSHDLPETSDPKDVTPAQRLLAVGAALIGVVGLTLTYTVIRAIGKRAHTMHTMMYFAMSSILCTTISMLVSKTQFIIPSGEALTLLFMIGFFGFFGQLDSAHNGHSTRDCKPRNYGDLYAGALVVWAMIFERAVFHTVPTRLSVIGTLLIVFSAIYIVLTKQKEPAASLSITVTVPPMSTNFGDMEEGLLSSSEDTSKITKYGSTR
ncbi:hypothetical protein NLJ89_g1021 [Agrocybe chaxingu]|uniref:EamA domain-containing protein n=1 Tax=Agrocybe chaxingu TaxID=84603 RepID=A0A9W8TF42_9AGAR|nr:hypothetical protein NLJ89_g1021 [Agrocybe chaxingu]